MARVNLMFDEPPPPRDDHDDDINSPMTDEIELGEDDEDGDCQYAPSSIGSPAPKCCMLGDEDDTLEILAAAADNAEDPYPICVYDPEWFDLPSDACPRILVFLVLSVPQVTGRGIAESNSLHVPSPAPAPSPNDGGPRKRDHRGDEFTPLLYVPPRMQTSSGRVTASYAFDTRWACRRRLPKKVRDALGAARRLDRSRRITLRRMWACFPEVDPLPFLPDKEGELKVRTAGTPRLPPQPDHHEGRQQPMATPVARAVPRHDGRNDAIIDTNKASPHNLHGTMFGNIDPIPGAWWMFKTVFTLVRRSGLQGIEEQSLDKPFFGNLVE